MVAGEHFHPQAGGVSLGDGAAGGVTRRVVQRDEAEHVKLGLEPLVIEEASLGSSRSATARTRKPLRAQFSSDGPQIGALLLVERRPLEYDLGAPLTRARVPMGLLYTTVKRLQDESKGLADGGSRAWLTLSEIPRSRTPRRNAPSTGSPAIRTKPFSSITFAVEASAPATRPPLVDAGSRAASSQSQLVLGQRSRLVGCHHGRFERFHSRQTSDDCSTPRHGTGTAREGDRHRRRQSFRNSRDRHGDADEERFVCRRSAGEHRRREDQGDGDADATMIRARPLIRFCGGVAGGRAGGQRCDPSDLGLRSGKGHESKPSTPRHPCPCEDHWALLGQRCFLRDGSRPFSTGSDSPVKGFVDGKPLRADKAAVGEDSLAFAEYEEVTGNDVLGRDQALGAGTDDGRMQWDGLAKRQNGSFSAQLLGEAEDAVQNDDGGDDARLDGFAYDGRHDSRGDKESDQGVPRPDARDLQVARALRALDGIWADSWETVCRLGFVEALSASLSSRAAMPPLRGRGRLRSRRARDRRPKAWDFRPRPAASRPAEDIEDDARKQGDGPVVPLAEPFEVRSSLDEPDDQPDEARHIIPPRLRARRGPSNPRDERRAR